MPEHQAPARVVVSATAALILAVVPVYMLGAMAVYIRADFAFGERALGLTVGAYFLAMSATSVYGGRLAERIGPRRTMIFTSTVSGTVLLLIAVTANSAALLLILVTIGGLSGGIAIPATSLALVRGVTDRPGLMFGLFQSAPPVSSLLSGLAVPFIGVHYGWRWSYLIAVVLVVIVVVSLPPEEAYRVVDSPPVETSSTARPRNRDGMKMLSIGMAFGSASAISIGAFFVTSAVDSGIAPATAGLLFAGVSVASIAVRVVAGALSDHFERGHLQAVAAMLLAGAAGYFALSITDSIVGIALAGVAGYGIGYGWSGLLFFAVSKSSPESPAVAIGIVNLGATAGAALGPAAFGFIVAATSFSSAWLVAGGISILGTAFVGVSAVRLESSSMKT